MEKIRKHKASMLLHLVKGVGLKGTAKCTRNTIGGECNAKIKRNAPHFTTGIGKYKRYVCYLCGKSLSKFALVDVAVYDGGYKKLDKSTL